jgi:peptide/nickel transport system permease protein
MRSLRNALRQLAQYPSAIIGILIIVALIALSIYTMFAIPYAEAIRLWRGGEAVWIETPRNALPSWVNVWPGVNLPDTLNLNTFDDPETKTIVPRTGETSEAHISFTFDYTYDGFPQELSVFFWSSFNERRPHASLTWITPDGREIRMGDFSVGRTESYRVSQDTRLQRRVGNQVPHVGLFADPDRERAVPLHGTYELRIEGLLFEEGADLDARFVVYGQVYGMAGTDHRRRDLMVAILWGTPIALAFGLLAAVGATISTMIVAAAGVWFGGWIDGLIQRITEVNLILPVLPILVMVGTFYSRSIWVMLGVVIALGIFSASIKTYRAMFLQIKEAPYIEAAKSYGAGNLRVVFNYMIPRAIPVLIPQFVVLIPSYVFLEASLAVLGLGDPVLPTWGKVINDAYVNGALFRGQYYWVLSPSFLLMLTGLGFAMVGFALDRIFNPRLRTI